MISNTRWRGRGSSSHYCGRIFLPTKENNSECIFFFLIFVIFWTLLETLVYLGNSLKVFIFFDFIKLQLCDLFTKLSKWCVDKKPAGFQAGEKPKNQSNPAYFFSFSFRNEGDALSSGTGLHMIYVHCLKMKFLGYSFLYNVNQGLHCDHLLVSSHYSHHHTGLALLSPGGETVAILVT